ncbi:DUF3795 domain-containing protein [Amedibacillus sp. YH-ame10]
MDKVISCCGVVCSECQYYPTDCEGCPKIKGHAFWLQFTDEEVCAIYECCVNQKDLSHCGKCKKLPCKRYDGTDPTKSEEENTNDFIKQLEQLRSMDR